MRFLATFIVFIPNTVLAWNVFVEERLFERSEFLIDTSQKQKVSVCLCGCPANLGFSVRSANRPSVWMFG